MNENDRTTIVTTVVVDAEPEGWAHKGRVEYAADSARDDAADALAEADHVTDADITIADVDERRQRATLRVTIEVDDLDAALDDAILVPEDSFLLPCEYIAEHSNLRIYDASG